MLIARALSGNFHSSAQRGASLGCTSRVELTTALVYR